MANEKRLIDANALIDDWNKAIKRMVRDSDGKVPIDFGLVICAVSKAPTVDAVEVVHGRMVEVTPDAECPWHKVWECSLCGNRGDVWYNYCPNCGAKMDGASLTIGIVQTEKERRHNNGC